MTLESVVTANVTFSATGSPTWWLLLPKHIGSASLTYCGGQLLNDMHEDRQGTIVT
jgi:hypothetical protein